MIKVELVGGDALIAKFKSAPARLHASLRDVMYELAVELQAKVKSKLSGEVLKTHTGTLRRSINIRLIDDDKNGLFAAVGTNVEYAARHEYGFHGEETVRAHIRRSRARMAEATYTYTNARGEMVTKTRTTGKHGRSTGDIQVHSFSRHANTPERSYLRSSLREQAGTIRGRLASSVVEALRK